MPRNICATVELVHAAVALEEYGPECTARPPSWQPTRQGAFVQARSDCACAGELMGLDYYPASQKLIGAAKFKMQFYPTILKGKIFAKTKFSGLPGKRCRTTARPTC